MLSAENCFANFVMSEIELEASRAHRDAEMCMYWELDGLANVSQGHVWDTIDFYSRPAVVESAEIDAYEAIENGFIWIEMEDHGYVNGSLIEDYYEGGKVWTLK